MLAGGPISWSTKRQHSVSLSTVKAEYVAASLAAQDLKWLHLLLTELGVQDLMPKLTIIHEDNQGAIALTENNKLHARTKHIDIKHHFVRDLVDKGDCVFHYIPTAEQAADGLTKPLGKILFLRFVNQLHMRSTPG